MALKRPTGYRFAGGVLLSLGATGLLALHFFWRDTEITSLPAVRDCALHMEPCSASLPKGGSMVFGIEPRQPAPDQVFNLRADFEGIEPETVGARFRGVNMNMGQLEYYVHWLSREDSQDGSVSFSGKGGVFACSTGVMQWQVLVRLQVDGRVYEVPFAFETINPGT